MNLGPVMERTPWQVCHLCRSWGSGRAPAWRSTDSRASARTRSARFWIGLMVAVQGGSQTRALFHIDDVAVLGEPVDQGGRQMVILEERTPFTEAKVGGDERGLFLVALVHEGEEESDL